MGERKIGSLWRGLVLELIVYGTLVVTYFLVVLRLLGEPLAQLFHRHPTFYALVTLGLIVAQGVLLDLLTSFLLDRLKSGRQK